MYRCQLCQEIVETVFKFGFCKDCYNWYEALEFDDRKLFWKRRHRVFTT
jgi:hypothetical protein